MILNLKIEGLPEQIVEELVAKGIASNKSEAIRLMILHYNEHFGIKSMRQYLDDELAVKKMQKIDKEIEGGKRKVLTEKEVLKKYPHLRDV
ncbi:hypothetical protein H0O02_00410 [Candidatus Micrarchaeota archaeon]|nr:hypothetical protein [Candidatus Micrarchaeota archaeon]